MTVPQDGVKRFFISTWVINQWPFRVFCWIGRNFLVSCEMSICHKDDTENRNLGLQHSLWDRQRISKFLQADQMKYQVLSSNYQSENVIGSRENGRGIKVILSPLSLVSHVRNGDRDAWCMWGCLWTNLSRLLCKDTFKKPTWADHDGEMNWIPGRSWRGTLLDPSVVIHTDCLHYTLPIKKPNNQLLRNALLWSPLQSVQDTGV